MSLQEMLLDELRDLYHAEKQLIRALPKMAKAVTHDDLRDAIEMHLDETREQATRLEEVFAALGEKVRAKPCHGMAGILEEGSELLQEHDPSATLDAAIIAGAQRVEHYEIGAYGTCAEWARLLGLDEVVALLEQTLEEEKATDKKLTALAEQEINRTAAAEGEEDTEEEEQSSSRGGRSSGRGRATSARSSSRGSSARRQSSSGGQRAKAADRRRR